MSKRRGGSLPRVVSGISRVGSISGLPSITPDRLASLTDSESPTLQLATLLFRQGDSVTAFGTTC